MIGGLLWQSQISRVYAPLFSQRLAILLRKKKIAIFDAARAFVAFAFRRTGFVSPLLLDDDLLNLITSAAEAAATLDHTMRLLLLKEMIIKMDGTISGAEGVCQTTDVSVLYNIGRYYLCKYLFIFNADR